MNWWYLAAAIVAIFLLLTDPVLLGAFVFGVPAIFAASWVMEKIFGPKRNNQ